MSSTKPRLPPERRCVCLVCGSEFMSYASRRLHAPTRCPQCGKNAKAPLPTLEHIEACKAELQKKQERGCRREPLEAWEEGW